MLRFAGFRVCLLVVFLLQTHQALAFYFKHDNRNHIRIVGSSTVYPFVSVIAETFGRNSSYRTPIVEATGTGGGFKLFCSGIGYSYPDFSNASRPIKDSEIKRCASNNIKNIFEIKIGYDGIVIANSTISKKFNLSKSQLFLALASKVPDSSGKLVDNFYKKWNEIDSSLPNLDISIYGPPPTSGTRDAFVELVMEDVCFDMKHFIKAYPDSNMRKKICHLIRSDGKFIEAGENDNLIVQKLKSNNDALGIFGFSFLQENKDQIQAAKIDDIEPSFDSIILGSYKISRSLYMYFKGEHLDLVPGMQDFVKEIISDNTIGKDGYLLQKGLIPLSDW
jgi:phosphate transport system substrate-binding protein